MHELHVDKLIALDRLINTKKQNKHARGPLAPGQLVQRAIRVQPRRKLGRPAGDSAAGGSELIRNLAYELSARRTAEAERTRRA